MLAGIMTGMQRIRAQRGLIALIARELGITGSAISMWVKVPPDRVPAVARITGIPRHQLRPDLWEAPESAGRDTLAASQQAA